MLATPNNTPSNVLPIRNIAERDALTDRHWRISVIRASKYGTKQLSIGKEDIDMSLNSAFKNSISLIGPLYFFRYLYLQFSLLEDQ